MTAAAPTICKRVLVVEDHHDCATALAALLKRYGHQVTTAHNCAQAMDQCQSGAAFDVLLLDIILPDGSGLDLAPRFRKKYPDALLVAMTALGMPRDVAAIQGAGFNAHVLKPFRVEQLLAHMQ